MNRDFIIIVGAQGYGKSFWAKLYTRLISRLLVYDFKLSYPNVIFQNMTEEIFDNIVNNKGNFRIGSGDDNDIDILSNLSYVAGNCTLVIEECGTVFSRGQILESWAKRNIFSGREQDANLIFLAQRATSIPKDIRSQANRIVSFMQHDPDDVHALTSLIGRKYHFEIPKLPMFSCLDWKNGQVTQYSILNDVKKYFPRIQNNDRDNVSDMSKMA